MHGGAGGASIELFVFKMRRAKVYPYTMNISGSYSRVAVTYAQKIFDELSYKPKDRELLNAFADKLGANSRVCDLGCGPGQVACYLKLKGLNSFGIDISPGMVEEAQRRNPDLDFLVGDIFCLPLKDEEVDGVVAFYSLIHIEKKEMPKALVEIKRVLKPGALFLFSFHIGDKTEHLSQWWGQEVNIDFHFFEVSDLSAMAQTAGFKIVEIIEREPYEEKIEVQTRRAYFLVQKPKDN